jgi:hypothetical protein
MSVNQVSTGKIGEGVPSAATYEDIIKNLFQNETIKNDNGYDLKIVFARAKLSKKQKSKLSYPDGFTPINKYLLYQGNVYQNKKLVRTNIQLVSFISKNDGFIYAYYFDVLNQNPFNLSKLRKSHRKIKLANSAVFNVASYLEVYHNINGLTTILSLSNTEPYASLQYSVGRKYYYSSLKINGIVDTHIPITKLTGLSKNLK